MRTITISIFALLISGLFSGCDSFETKWIDHITKNVYTFKYPSYFEPDSTLKPDADFCLVNNKKEVYCLVLVENKDSLAYYGMPDMTIADYAGLMKTNHRNSGYPIKLISEKKAKVNGMQANEMIIEQDYSKDNGGTPSYSKGKQVAIEGKKNFFQLFIWCKKENFNDYIAEFDKIIASFKEL